MSVSSSFWHDKKLLRQTGMLPQTDARSHITTNPTTNKKSHSDLIRMAINAGIGGDSIRTRKYRKGFSQTIDLTPNTQMIPLNLNTSAIIPDTLAVYKNGGESLIEGEDYVIDGISNTLILTYPTKHTDDDVEIRCQLDISSDFIVEDVLLLPRNAGTFEFDDEQLRDLMPTIGMTFNVDKLLRFGNQQLIIHAGKQLNVLECDITKDGIIATMIL